MRERVVGRWYIVPIIRLRTAHYDKGLVSRLQGFLDRSRPKICRACATAEPEGTASISETSYNWLHKQNSIHTAHLPQFDAPNTHAIVDRCGGCPNLRSSLCYFHFWRCAPGRPSGDGRAAGNHDPACAKR